MHTFIFLMISFFIVCLNAMDETDGELVDRTKIKFENYCIKLQNVPLSKKRTVFGQYVFSPDGTTAASSYYESDQYNKGKAYLVFFEVIYHYQMIYKFKKMKKFSRNNVLLCDFNAWYYRFNQQGTKLIFWYEPAVSLPFHHQDGQYHIFDIDEIKKSKYTR